MHTEETYRDGHDVAIALDEVLPLPAEVKLDISGRHDSFAQIVLTTEIDVLVHTPAIETGRGVGMTSISQKVKLDQSVVVGERCFFLHNRNDDDDGGGHDDVPLILGRHRMVF